MNEDTGKNDIMTNEAIESLMEENQALREKIEELLFHIDSIVNKEYDC